MMTQSWLPVDDSERLAVAIYNYCGDGDRCLVFSLGDVVHVLQRCAGWCYGYTAINPDFHGVFPASYVRLKKCIVDKTTGRDTVILRENPLLHEITAVIREWGQICRSLFVSRDDKLAETRRMLLQLIVHRRRIVSGTLPADELRTIKRVVTSTIDRGNLLLGLDLVVRDEQGNMINPDLISAVELYRHHHRATQHMYTTQSRNSGDVSSRSSSISSSHCLYVSIENFVSRVEEDCELILFLYDATSQRVLTENYIVVWGKELLTRDLHQLANMRVLFTDLSSVDVELDRLYLVCFVVKTGVSCRSELSSRRASQASFKNSITHSTVTLSSLGGEQCRRPCGVAALELSTYISDGLTSDEDKHHFMPFLQCGEKENLEGTLRKLVAMRDIGNREHKGHGLWFSFKFLQGDITEVRSGHPHLVMGPMSVALKRDFPDLLEPGGERNDLYLTLTAGEFGRGGKGQDRNVEVTVRVLNADGHVMSDAILPGAGCTPVEQYRSVVYRHEGRPRWAENIKVKLTVEEYDVAHLRFTFKHRSASEVKDKSERPFALAFLRLKENNDIALRNRLHDLNVFRLEGKRYDEGDTSYLRLPSHREDVATASRSSSAEYALSGREYFSVESQLCSDGLTQNVDLLQVLQCRSCRPDVLGKLHLLHRVPREELLRFLRAVLDVLFYVLDSHQQSADVVFSALLTLISSVDDQKYHQFQAVLDKYLEDDFSSVLVGGKLIAVMLGYLGSLSDSGSHRQLVKSLKCLRYICKITIRSHELHYSMYGRAGCDDLGSSVLAMLKGMSSLMNCPLLEAVQLSCLRHIPESLDSLSVVCDPVLLCKVMSELLAAASSESLSTQRLHCISSLVQLQLFQQPECRLQLLPVLTSVIAQLFDVHKQQGVGSMETLRQRGRSTAKLAKLFGEQQTEVIGQDRVQTELEMRQNELHICVRIMGDVLDVLWKLGGASAADMAQITSQLLRQLIQTVICMDRDDPLVCSLEAILISVLRQMNKCHYDFFMSELVHLPDQLFFLMEVLMVFRDLISKCVFPFHWCEMIMLQNSVILKSLRFFSHTIRDRFMQPFEIQMCNNFFHCAIAFLTQAPLQLENFTANKKSRLLHRYKDMRKATALEIHTMWISLGQHKISFVPSMVGPFLEMTLVPDAELRAMTVPLFFDMMQCEFYSPCRPGVGYGDTKRDAQAIKCNFDQFEREMISKLDHLIEGGRGDADYLQVFKLKMTENCEKHSSMKEQGLRFVGTVVKLLERLLEYRDIMRDEYRENKMSCTVHLLHFYCDIDCRDMYMRYLDKLCSLHLSASNYIEAGFTLKLHTDLLHWSDEPLSTLLRHARHPQLDTHRALKEALYYCIIDYFDKGNLWEAALQFCKELCVEYELETFDYTQLSRLLRRMSKLYERIMNDIRPPPEYFRVAFYGRAFPAFLQNKVYVYRGHGYERLGDFSCRVQAGFPKSELLSTLSSPGTEITEALQQYLQINKVDPCMDDRQRFSGRSVADRVLQYYRVNDVDRFSYSRPMPRGHTDPDNPFANLWLERTVLRTTYPLPGLLGWAPVEGTSTYDVTPLENAIETMTSVNSQLRQLILSHRSDSTLPLNPLTQKLSGTIDAAVMGGIANYEKAFFHGRYLEQRPDDVDMIDRLKLLIAKQIPLLEAALEIHAIRAAADLKPLQQRLEHVFSNMRADVQNKFGHQVSDLPCMRQVVRASGSRPVSATEHRRSSESGSCRFTGSPVRSQSVFYKQTGAVGASASSTASQDHLPPDRNRSSLTSQTDSLSSVELPEIRSHRLENERDRTQNSSSSSELSQQLHTNSSSSNTDYVLEFVECAAPPPLPRKQCRQLTLSRSESYTSESSPLPINSHEQDSSETRPRHLQLLSDSGQQHILDQ